MSLMSTLTRRGRVAPVWVRTWTGRHACALQAALGAAYWEFAAAAGVPLVEVMRWCMRPDTVPHARTQHALDALAGRLTARQRVRFARLLEGPHEGRPCAPWCAEHDEAAGVCVAAAGPVALMWCPDEGARIYLGEQARTADALTADEAVRLARRVLALAGLLADKEVNR